MHSTIKNQNYDITITISLTGMSSNVNINAQANEIAHLQEEPITPNTLIKDGKTRQILSGLIFHHYGTNETYQAIKKYELSLKICKHITEAEELIDELIGICNDEETNELLNIDLQEEPVISEQLIQKIGEFRVQNFNRIISSPEMARFRHTILNESKY